jgi:hypothetical protein
LCLFLALRVSSGWTQSQAGSASDQTSSTATQTKDSKKADSAAPANSTADPAKKPATKTAGANSVSDADISAAKAEGKVWVNLDSRIYHKSGRWYGKTKNGKFMTEDEAKAAGYKASHTN